VNASNLAAPALELWNKVRAASRGVYDAQRFPSGARDRVRLLVMERALKANGLGAGNREPSPMHVPAEELAEWCAERFPNHRGVSTSTVLRAIADLELAGLLVVERTSVRYSKRRGWFRPCLAITLGAPLLEALGAFWGASRRMVRSIRTEVTATLYDAAARDVRQVWRTQFTDLSNPAQKSEGEGSRDAVSSFAEELDRWKARVTAAWGR
jgi:hypothetical protein